MEEVSYSLRKDAAKILDTITKVESDGDWDGIASAVQIKAHYPDLKVRLANDKRVHSDITTLVLDQGTFDDGWVIDHHKKNSDCKNLLCFCEEGDMPTGRLTYLTLPKKNDTDLLISAMSEITDGLYEYGEKYGSLKELSKKHPNYFKHSKKHTQFMMNKEIYVMADVLAPLALHMQDSTMKLALKLYENMPRDADELMSYLNKTQRKMADEYFTFLENFPENLFTTLKIHDHEVKIADASKIGKFSYFAVSHERMLYPGNYILFRGKKISVRTEYQSLLDTLDKILKDRIDSSGGRKDWHAIRFKEEMDYQEFISIVKKAKK